MAIYFETLSMRSFICAYWKHALLRDTIAMRSCAIFFFDSSMLGEALLIPMLNQLGIAASRLNFEMRNIKDERGELLRLRIHRKDLFELQDQIRCSTSYKALYQSSWENDRVKQFIEKGLVDAFIMDPDSASRIAYLIGVIQWHNNHRANASEVAFIANARPWFAVYETYARKYGIRLLSVGCAGMQRRGRFAKAIYSFPRVYTLLRTIKENGWPKFPGARVVVRPRIYVDGRGEVNLRNDGYHSDFFWHSNSSFPAHSIVYRPHSKLERIILEAHGISVAEAGFGALFAASSDMPSQLRGPRHLKMEKNLISGMLRSYNCNRTFWRSVFSANLAKIYITWNRYENYHMAIADAIRDVGGISVYLPIAFDGWKAIEGMTNVDIAFSFSARGMEMDKQCQSFSQYRVITGYPRDYAAPLLKQEGERLRAKLQSSGARKIVFVIDENSGDDARWHTGHALQRENYSYILERVLETPWLGVVFKPKVARTLRRRLGPVAEQLARAERTGRWYVYEATSRDVTSAPPLLAGLSADVCIHGHLCSGTAALECALAGLPTLLIDREGTPDSLLYELPSGKVVFQNWPDTMDALMEHFRAPLGVAGFGDWSSLIESLDPFRDGMAANRIGTYLHWLIEGFERGLDRTAVMAEAAEKYGRQWGTDKIGVDQGIHCGTGMQ